MRGNSTHFILQYVVKNFDLIYHTEISNRYANNDFNINESGYFLFWRIIKITNYHNGENRLIKPIKTI